MKVSMIVISYNEREYLYDSIKSCMNQNAFQKGCEYEIIIGDDGSTDGSIDLIKEIESEYPTIVKSFVMERNEEDIIASIRVSSVIKKAFTISTGDYIQILSGDDILCSVDKVTESLTFLENHPEYTCCYTDYKHFWDDGTEEYVKTCSNQFSNTVLWVSEYRHISCFMFRREVINNLLCRYCDDLGMIYSCLISGKAKHIPGVFFGYRQRHKSIVHSSNELESAITDLMLLQDILNNGKYRYSSIGKFYWSIIKLKKKRGEIKNKKYSKYLNNSNKYDNDVLSLLVNYDLLNFFCKIKLNFFIYESFFINLFYRVLHKIELIVTK